jgi:beta-phosphoglucomutase-like phosphatase (HAD superfamily)
MDCPALPISSANLGSDAQSGCGSRSAGNSGLLEVIVDLSDVSEPKPSPEIYLTAVSRLALSPSQCMVVEDALTGVLSAKRAGCVVSALTRTFKSEALLKVEADFTFESFAKHQCFLENDLRNQAKPSL